MKEHALLERIYAINSILVYLNMLFIRMIRSFISTECLSYGYAIT